MRRPAQRLIDDQGVSASESSVRRWIPATCRNRRPGGRTGPAAGGAGQRGADRLRQTRDVARSGQRCRHAVWAFVMVLACSRRMFVQPVLRMDQTSWCASHVAAFEFFGGCPARLVPDNLKTGVSTAGSV